MKQIIVDKQQIGEGGRCEKGSWEDRTTDILIQAASAKNYISICLTCLHYIHS